MTIELTPEEKKSIVEQHLKNTAYAEYNVDLNSFESVALPVLNVIILNIFKTN